MTIEELKEMFVGKRVKISSIYGSRCVPYPSVVMGNCIAIHTVPIKNAPFDIELDTGDRFGFLPEKHDSKSCSGTLLGISGRIRTIEVIG